MKTVIWWIIFIGLLIVFAIVIFPVPQMNGKGFLWTPWFNDHNQNPGTGDEILREGAYERGQIIRYDGRNARVTKVDSDGNIIAIKFVDTSDPASEPDDPPEDIDHCPNSREKVATLVGGSPKEWTRNWPGLNPDTQWKRKPTDNKVHLEAPWGTLNVWNGHKTVNGTSATGFEATWNCG
jgi:hypothetical protein